MKYQVHSSVIVIPTELSKLFHEILDGPEYSEYSLDCLVIDEMTSEDGFTYFRFGNSEEDFRYLEEALDDSFFPFNYYPSDLDEVVIINRFNEKGIFIGTTINYSAFLEINLYGNKSRYFELYKDKIGKENKWDNQVDNCLANRLLKLL